MMTFSLLPFVLMTDWILLDAFAVSLWRDVLPLFTDDSLQLLFAAGVWLFYLRLYSGGFMSGDILG